MKRAMGGRWGAGFLLVAIAGAALGGCARRSGEAESPKETQVLVSAADVARVEMRRLETGTTFTGALEPSEMVQVNARFDGDLDEVLVREGQAVRKGQPLARFEPQDIRAQLQAAESDVLSAQAALLAAENAERRAQRLLEAGAAAPSELEVAKAQRAAAEAQVRAAEARRTTARENAERIDVPSPISGWVSRVFRHAGDRTAVGDPIMEVVDTRELELSATVPAEALARARPGTPIRFRVDAYPGETFEGTVDRVSPTTEPGTRQVRIYARIDNADGRLAGGLFATGRIVDEAKDDAKAAPVASLRTEGTEQVVYRLRNGRANRVPVRTGIVDEEAGVVELIGDLAAGDSLLTGVLPGLRDGAPVRVLASETAGAAAGGGAPAETAASPAGGAARAPANTPGAGEAASPAGGGR